MLNGQTILILEEEFLIALDIQRVLEVHHAKQTVFARTVDEAFALSGTWSDFNLALLEFQNDGQKVLALAKALRDAGVAIVLTASDSTMRRGCEHLPGTPVVIKPFLETDLIDAIHRALPTQATDTMSPLQHTDRSQQS